jgi:hypothetical protein
MAEIDKGLIPNIGSSLTPEQEIEQVVSETETVSSSPTEVTENEDGSVDINFDPKSKMDEASLDHGANLAEFIDENDLNLLGTELGQNYEDYKSSRKDWEQAYTQGLDLLGFKYEQRTEPFQGASGATHPVLAEAVTQFQALAYKELLPAEGPVRTQVIGASTPDTEQQAERVKEFMNYQIMDVMKEYEPEFDQMLFYLPLSGSTFKKVYYDETLGRAVSQFIPAEDLVVPYSATSLEDAEAIVHVLRISANDLRKQQVNGFYRDIELLPADDGTNTNDVKDKEKQLEGITKSEYSDEVFTFIRMSC